MKPFTLFSILALLLAFNSKALAQHPESGITLYTDPDFQGWQYTLHENWSQNYGEAMNIESIRVSPGWQIEVYTGPGFTGDRRVLTSDWNGRGQDAWQWCNHIYSVKILQRPRICGTPDPPPVPMVTLFEHQNFQGKTLQLEADWTIQRWNEFWNDRVSSISIPQGLVVTVFEHSNFTGRSMTLRGDWSARAWNDAWNDRISSVQIRYEGALGYR